MSAPEIAHWEPIQDKEPWTDFTADATDTLFGHVLDREFDLPEPPLLYPAQLQARDERSFESVLVGHNCIIVNAALKAATKYLAILPVTWLVGSYAPLMVSGETSSQTGRESTTWIPCRTFSLETPNSLVMNSISQGTFWISRETLR